MRSTIEQLHDQAKRHSRRAAELKKRCTELRQAATEGTVANDAADAKLFELNKKIEDEYKQAANVMNFLQRYKGGNHVAPVSSSGSGSQFLQ